MTGIIALFWLLYILSHATSRSLDSSSSLVIKPLTDNTNLSRIARNSIRYVRPEIYEMRVDTNVLNRYAKTLITTKVRNTDDNSQEAVFSIVIPEKAFISAFFMKIDGNQYVAHVKDKEDAKQTYKKAVSQGKSAAHVTASARDSNRFTVSVNLEPESKVLFYLTYEELLERRDGIYELVLNIHPGQLTNLKVQVYISEARPLKFIKVPSLRTGNKVSKCKQDLLAKFENINSTSAFVTFSPNNTEQELFAKKLGSKGSEGIQGQFVVQYDVERDPRGGEVLIAGGYFVHFFAPKELRPLKKQVIFVLDTSGSMSGSRITQLKQAMSSILDELKPEDTLSIIEFYDSIGVWNIPLVERTDQKSLYPPSVAASPANVDRAKQVMNKLRAGGFTNIYGALEAALKVTDNNRDSEGRLPMIIFLTDGEANIGISDPDSIISEITEMNIKKVPIYSLSFGDGARKDFLRKLSLKNQGFTRHIYEAADAFLQLGNFYKQISSPLLSNVKFKYVDNVANVTRTQFPVFYRGGELMTAGIIQGSEFDLGEVGGTGSLGSINFKPTVHQATDSLERLWAYLTVKQYLEDRNVKENASYTQKALELSLRYSFVTEISSLVVIKPNSSTAVDIEVALPSQEISASNPYSASANDVDMDCDFDATKANSNSETTLQPDTVIRIVPMSPNETAKPAEDTSWLEGRTTVKIGSKIWSLGTDLESVEGQNCDNSLKNQPGTCSLISECYSMSDELVDLNALKKYFCEVASGIAGVCCPDPIPKTAV